MITDYSISIIPFWSFPFIYNLFHRYLLYYTTINSIVCSRWEVIRYTLTSDFSTCPRETLLLVNTSLYPCWYSSEAVLCYQYQCWYSSEAVLCYQYQCTLLFLPKMLPIYSSSFTWQCHTTCNLTYNKHSRHWVGITLSITRCLSPCAVSLA